MAIELAEAGPSTPPNGRSPAYKLAHSLGGHSRSVTALRFSSDSSVLVSAGADGYIHLWDPRSGEYQRSIRAHRAGINDLDISPDDLYLATGSDDKLIHVHALTLPPTSTGAARIRKLKAHTAPVLCVAFSPKSDLLVSGSFDESAIIWDVKGGKVLRVLPAHSEAVWTVGWDREGGMVITGSADGLIRLWDAHTGQCLKTVDNDTNSPVSYAAFTPSSTYLLSSTLSSTLRIYNIHTSKVLKTLRAPTLFVSEQFPCPAVLFPALPSIPKANGMDVDGEQYVVAKGQKGDAWVASGSENGKIVIWELSSRRVAQVLERGGHRSPVVAIAVSPDGRYMATGSLEPEKVVHIWQDDS